MFKIDHESMTAPEDQIWTWVEKNSVVNLEFDFRAQSLMQLQIKSACLQCNVAVTVKHFRMLKSSIFLERK